MAPRSVRFYIDYVSPNAYLAWTALPALAGDDPLEPAGWDGWSTLPRPSATRSREQAGT